MQYWLVKSEPSEWCWEMQVGNDLDGESWIGVRNHQTRRHQKHVQDMKQIQQKRSVQTMAKLEWNAIQK